MKPRVAIPIILMLALVAGFFIWPGFSGKKPFKLGLDLRGGTHLVYEADVSQIQPAERDEAMEGLKDVIERRINLFGVAEPVVTVNRVGGHQRLVVELAGILDANEAIRLIGETPFLEFREERPVAERDEILKKIEAEDPNALGVDPYFLPTPLTGRFLKRAQVGFDPQTTQPIVLLEFNEEGKNLFGEITRRNVGKRIAIYLDGLPLSAPVVQEEITGGSAQITGTFSIAEVKNLTSNLNAGALPVPITLISQQTIGPTLGQESLKKSLVAGGAGFILVALFMVLYYRVAGVIAVLALIIYSLLVLALFKLIPVTLTLAGIVGFILSIGMAVDANILIFERLKEELRAGRSFASALEEGFNRAWAAIRDAYTSTLFTAAVLYWFGTSLVRGFALTLAIGLLVSLFAALFITKNFLRGMSATRLANVKALWRQ